MKPVFVVLYLLQMSMAGWAVFLAGSAWAILAYVAGVIYGVTAMIGVRLWREKEHA